MNIGDKVQALDDDFEGIILSINDNDVEVQDQDGFSVMYSYKELVVIDRYSLDIEQMSEVPFSVIREKEGVKKKKSQKITQKQRSAPTMEVDLHIHKIVKRGGRLSNYEMLNIQIDTARSQLNFAIKKRISKMVFIHGVGEGVLREELYTLLRRYEGIKFYDADFKKYGAGATEVYIFQNAKI